MEAFALTRASTIGPIADMLAASGGSVERVFRNSGLPLALIDAPDKLILLQDQFRLIENAAREIGDDALPARLSTTAGLQGLGPYGRHFMSFDRLGPAIVTAYRSLGSLLQASTHMDLIVKGRSACWTYRITAPITIGRQKNELLALGYMLQALRQFTGSRWTPECIRLPGRLQGRNTIEDIFAGEVAEGPCTAVIFPAEILELPNPSRKPHSEAPVDRVPDDQDIVGVVEEMIKLGLLAGRLGIDRIAARLGLARRTLQRQLAAQERTFEALCDDVRRTRALVLMRQNRRRITDVAMDLGYSDAAHFTRAFRRWTGESPREFRMRQAAIASGP